MEVRVVRLDGQGEIAGVQGGVEQPIAPVGGGEIQQTRERGPRDPGVKRFLGFHRERRRLGARSEIPVEGTAVDDAFAAAKIQSFPRSANC